jgi:beta-lactamase class A
MVRGFLFLSLAVLMAAFRPLPAARVSGEPLVAPQITVSAQQCDTSSPGSVSATISWVPSRRGNQWLDISLFNNRFAPGTFAGIGPFPPDTSSFVWSGLQPRLTHFLRINTRSPYGWEPSQTVAFATQACSDDPALPQPNGELVGLRDRLWAEIAASGLNAAVAVTDLQTGESIDVNGDEPRLPGCTINFFVLLSVVMDLQEGLYGESEVGDLIARTVWSSNPITARDLLRRTGMGDLGAGLVKVDQLLDLLGLSLSTYDHPPAFPHESLQGSVNLLTANEMNRALVALYQARIVDPAWRDYLLNKMMGVKPGLQYLIPAGVGDGVVSHKNGFFADFSGWVDNDAGVVIFDRSGNRYAYAISFFTEDVPSKYADIPLGQTVSRLVWQYFSSRYY